MRKFASLLLLFCFAAEAGPNGRYRVRTRVGRPNTQVVTLLQDGQGYDATSGTLSLSDGTTVTVSRSGVMTCTDDNWATFTTAAADKPCVVGGALHVAPGGTNLALRSQEFDNASWSKDGCSAACAPVVTANAVTAPDGTLTADQVVFTAGVGASRLYQTSGQDLASNAFAASVWLRTASGTQSVSIFLENGTSGAGVGTPVTAVASTTWQRFSLTATASGVTAGQKARLFLTNLSGAETTVYAFGAQLEVSAVMLPYSPTLAATVTRGGQIVTVPTPFFVTDAQGSASAHFFGHASQATNSFVIGFGATPRLSVTGSTAWTGSDGSTAPNQLGSSFLTASRFGQISWSGTSYYTTSNTATTTTAYDGSMGLGVTIGIGSSPSSASTTYGRVKNVCFSEIAEVCQ